MESAPLKELSDKELFILVKEQENSDAAVELVNRVYGYVNYLAAQFARTCSDYEQQDFCQQGLIGVVHALRDYDPDKNVKFLTYASTCAINSMNNLYDHHEKHSVPTVSLEVLLPGAFPEGTYDDINSYELIEELTQKIKTRLSDFEKKVLAMHVCGESYASIAQKTGKSVKSIDNAIQRIRRKLKAD